MQRKFVTNLALLLFLNLLIKPVWIFGIDRTVQNTVGAESYGHYYALFNFSFLLNILLDLGITNFNSRNIARHSHLVQKHLAGILSLRMALAGLYAVVTTATGLAIGYGPAQFSLLGLLLLNQVLVSLILYLRSNFAGLHQFKTDSVLSVLDRFLMIGLCAWLLWGRPSGAPFRIEWFVWAQSFAYGATAAAALALLAARTGLRRLRWNPLFNRSILRQSYPFALLILLMTFYNRIDTVMLERLLPDGERQAGIYAQAFRLLDAAGMVPFLFAGLLLPMFSRMLRQNQPVGGLLRLSYSLLVVPAFAAAIVSWFYRSEIMHWLYVRHAGESATVFGLLMVSYTGIATTYLYGTLLTANGNLRLLNWMAGGAMALNLALNLALIPKYQAAGAAVASLVTQCAAALAQALLSYRLFGMRPDGRFLAALAGFLAASIAAVALLRGLPLSWAWSLPLSLFACALLAWLLGLLRPGDVFRIVSERGD
jgi:O-antigen/teichoic acid export membrane protein